MAGLKLNHIYKVYPNGTKAVSDFTMDIDDKEFIIFVGPSGCGKSTTLRMIAGLEDITTGELSIDGVVVNDLEPKDRDIAMVFQNYALYPHMTVYDNMAFGLKLRKMSKENIDSRVKEAAEILGLTEYLKKKPKEMSGGQRQRVALGRAIVREPKVFLLDEPLSNLDAKLRTQMRSEILKLHRKLQTTFIYVTHDQIEAMTMGTRIVVMKAGVIQQIDSPRNLYNYPCNKFVAGFIGTPQMNFFNGSLTLEGDKVNIVFDGTDVKLTAEKELFSKVDPAYLDGTKKVTIGIRAEHISPDANAYPYKAACKISHYEDLGTDCQVYADFNLQSTESLDSLTKVVLKAPAGSEYTRDSVLEVSFDLSHCHLFDAETEESIAPRVPAFSLISGTVNKGALTLSGDEIKLPEAIGLADGAYDLHVPTDAVKTSAEAKEGFIAATFAGEERLNNNKLIKLAFGGASVYALSPSDGAHSFTDGGKIYFKIDLKRVSFYKDKNQTVAALPMDNMLEGTILKRKVVEERTTESGKSVKEKGFVIDFDIAGYAKEIPDETGRTLLASGNGKHLFDKKMQFHFSPYDVTISDRGIAAHIEKTLDYGTEKFAVCTVYQPATHAESKGKSKASPAVTVKTKKVTVIVAIFDDVAAGKNVYLEPDIGKLSIVDTEREIKLI